MDWWYLEIFKHRFQSNQKITTGQWFHEFMNIPDFCQYYYQIKVIFQIP